MDILHLRYVAEIAATGSMTQAAANLYMTQPNLSRAVRELEDELSFTIFNRSSKGVTLTREGREFLIRASDPLAAFEHLEARYKADDSVRRQFSISVPRDAYLARALALFAADAADTRNLDVRFRETDPDEALDDVLQRRQNMAIVRYPLEYEKYYHRAFRELSLFSEVLRTFEETLVFAESSPLNGAAALTPEALRPLIEVTGGPAALPAMGGARVPDHGFGSRRLLVGERASQLELLAAVPETYLWSPPAPPELLRRYGLVQRPAPGFGISRQDALIHPKDYRLSLTDQLFLRRLYELCLALPR